MSIKAHGPEAPCRYACVCMSSEADSNFSLPLHSNCSQTFLIAESSCSVASNWLSIPYEPKLQFSAKLKLYELRSRNHKIKL